MMMDLGRVVHELSIWQSGIGVVLTGAGDHFCSGGDLKLVKEISNFSDGELMARYMHGVTTQVVALSLVGRERCQMEDVINFTDVSFSIASSCRSVVCLFVSVCH